MVQAISSEDARRVEVLQAVARSAVAFVTQGRSLPALPGRVQQHVFFCHRARIEVRLDAGALSHPRLAGETDQQDCRVYSVKVYALAPESTAGDRDLGCFHLRVIPGSALSTELGRLLQTHYRSSSQASPPVHDNPATAERLLVNIEKAVASADALHTWLLRTCHTGCVAHNRLPELWKVRENSAMVRVLPSLADFIRDRSVLDRRLVGSHIHNGLPSVFEAYLSKDGVRGVTELRTYREDGGLLKKERRPLTGGELGDPAAWIDQLAIDVFKKDPGSSQPHANNTEARKHVKTDPLVSNLFEAMMVFRDGGPDALRELFRSPDAMHELSIREGKFSEDNLLRGPSPFGSRVWLEIGAEGTVARASVNVSSAPNSAAAAWYLESSRPFWDLNHDRLVKFWRAAELLTSAAEGAIETGVRILNSMCEPRGQAPRDIDSLLGIETSQFRALSFAGVKPNQVDQIVRAVEGIQDVEVLVTSRAPIVRYPENFVRMELSIHNDGALTVRAHNPFNAQISAFLSEEALVEAGGREAVITDLCRTLEGRPLGARVRFQALLEELANGPESWCVSVANQIESPHAPRDLPPAAAVLGNKAYTRAARAAATFAETFQVHPADIEISPVRAWSSKPEMCRVLLQVPHEPEKISLLFDHMGVLAASLFSPILRARPNQTGSTSATESKGRIKFVRRTDRLAPFSTQSELQELMRSLKNFRHELLFTRAKPKASSATHTSGTPSLIRLLSQEMRHRR